MSRNAGWIDTNIILRYLLKDHHLQSPRARTLFRQAKELEYVLQVPPFIVAEAVYVMEGQGLSRRTICHTLLRFALMPQVSVLDESEILQALMDYRDRSVAFPDALLMAYGRNREQSVWTFNTHHFTQLDGWWREPGVEKPDLT